MKTFANHLSFVTENLPLRTETLVSTVLIFNSGFQCRIGQQITSVFRVLTKYYNGPSIGSFSLVYVVFNLWIVEMNGLWVTHVSAYFSFSTKKSQLNEAHFRNRNHSMTLHCCCLKGAYHTTCTSTCAWPFKMLQTENIFWHLLWPTSQLKEWTSLL